MPLSVVIPLYNKELYIGRAIHSVLSQTYTEFELIVVDDGSTDGSADCVREFSDARIRLVQQANGGECAARNRGVAEAQGEWVAFLDADDEYLPEFLARCASFAARHPSISAVFSKYSFSVPSHLENSADHGGTLLKDYFLFTFTTRMAMTSSSVMISKTKLNSIGGFPVGVIHGGDLDTWARLAWSGEVGYIPEVLAIYHKEASSASKQNLVDWQMPYVVLTYRSWLKAGEIPPHLRRGSRLMVELQLRAFVRAKLKMDQRSWARQVLLRDCTPTIAVGGYVDVLLRSLVSASTEKRFFAFRSKIMNFFRPVARK